MREAITSVLADELGHPVRLAVTIDSSIGNSIDDDPTPDVIDVEVLRQPRARRNPRPRWRVPG